MTARRSSATERRGTAIPWRRPTAILLAAGTAVALGTTLAACASRNASTGQLAAKTLPGNQDTAAGLFAGTPSATPPGQSTPKPGNSSGHAHIHSGPTPVPSTSGPWTNDPDSARGLATLLTQGGPVMGLTPKQNPAPAPKAALEIIGIPMWLWIESPALQTTVGTHTITDQVVIDKAVWTMDGSATPFYTCGNPGGTALPSHGAGTPYDPAMDPSNAAAVPQACITTFSSPYYTTAGGVTKEATHTLTAVVDWHVEFTVTDNATGSVSAAAVVPGSAAVGVPAPGNRTFRIGEIQALAIGP